METEKKNILERVERVRKKMLLVKGNYYSQPNNPSSSVVSNQWGNSTSFDKGDDWENFHEFREK
jgi:hypothetical protein